MTLKEIFETGLVGDDVDITILRCLPNDEEICIKGKWYTDNILKAADKEVVSLFWNKEYGLGVTQQEEVG